MQRKTLPTILLMCILACLFALASCGTTPGPSTATGPKPVGERISPDEGKNLSAQIAKSRRDYWKNKTFEQFKATVYREPFEGGKFIVNGDTPVLNEKQLQEFFETQIKGEAPSPLAFSSKKLAVYSVNGTDIVWNSVEKRQLTYCVSTGFGTRYANVVQAMQQATGAWESVADVKFSHVSSQDAACTASNPQVLFDVRPVNVGGEYLARAFFPNDPRMYRNILIDDSAFGLSPGDKLTLTGILRHELGHTLGFRHEHTRPEAGTCYEDAEWRQVTNYDPFSVMHYPQCNGLGDWSLTLTQLDQQGAASIYGAPGGTTPPPLPTPKTKRYKRQHVNQGATKSYGPFSVSPGTVFEVKMAGETNPGDPDLYVSYGRAPTLTEYHCRPYLYGADEKCSLDVPGGESRAYVMVRGYTAGNYNLTVAYVPGP